MLSLTQRAQALCKAFDAHETLISLAYNGQRELLGVMHTQTISWEDLQEIDRQKQAVMQNMQRFMAGQSYNHMLLWGARGTGKSSLVRALFVHIKSQGQPLKLVQLGIEDLDNMAFLLWAMAQHSARFLVFIDDLSFAEEDGRYRALKAVLEGSIAGIGRNVMLCVTSNRRHLLAQSSQTIQARHPEEDDEEHISLSDRFGLRLAFHRLSQAQYLDLLAYLFTREGFILDEQAKRQALQYALARGSRSGRIAQQFLYQYQPISTQ